MSIALHSPDYSAVPRQPAALSVLQGVAGCCRVLQGVVECCRVAGLQDVFLLKEPKPRKAVALLAEHFAVCCSVCSVLQCVALWASTLGPFNRAFSRPRRLFFGQKVLFVTCSCSRVEEETCFKKNLVFTGYRALVTEQTTHTVTFAKEHYLCFGRGDRGETHHGKRTPCM